jgi:Bacterial TSP3 repeat
VAVTTNGSCLGARRGSAQTFATSVLEGLWILREAPASGLVFAEVAARHPTGCAGDTFVRVRRSAAPLRLVLASLASCVALACSGGGTVVTARPDVPDAAARTDRVIPMEASATGDMDGDGLCDLTEQQRRTDPRRVDSDGDGLLDSFEVRVGTDPLSGRDPFATDRVRFTEGDALLATIEHVTEYQGNGEVLSAAMLDRAAGLDGLRASELVDFSIEATTANPAAFVRAIEGPRFVGVLGRVVLQWRVSARPRSFAAMDGGVGSALGCRRAYEALLVLKREGDDVVSSRQLVVEFVPPSGSTATPAWQRVSADGFCLPERCF